METLAAIVLLFALLTLTLTALAFSDSLSGGPENTETVIDRIDALLPQTQCGKCHYAGCRPYARAIALGEADINQCPPGGMDTIKRLAALLGRDPKPLNPAYGVEPPPRVALIDEELCIGCVKCLRACPVDAIIGAPKVMHTVIKQYCTGCELCIAPCPVDCISMVPPPVKTREYVWQKPRPAYLVRT